MLALHDLKMLLLPPALLAWLLLGPLRPGWSRWLGLQVLLACVVEPMGWWMGRHGETNIGLYNLYMPAEFVLLSLVVWEAGARERRVLLEVLAGGLVFATAYGWQLASHGVHARFLSNALVIGGFVLMLQAAAGLYRMLHRSLEPLHRQPLFWALLSMVVYSVAVTPVLGLMHYLYAHGDPFARTLLSVNDVLFVVRYLLVTFAFVLHLRQHHTPA